MPDYSIYRPDTRESLTDTSFRPYDLRSLIKNGGFESPNPSIPGIFEDWEILTSEGSAITYSLNSHEGVKGAKFYTKSAGSGSNFAILRQRISVKPGTFYQLSFAENFISHGLGEETSPYLLARVSAPRLGVGADFINLIIYKMGQGENENKGYSFHQAVSNRPLFGLPDVIVDFTFSTTDKGGTEWLIDSVSLLPIAAPPMS